MSCDFDFDSMNETDVRETIVRPFLHQLGYRQGTEFNIITEKTLRYGHAFLGRKDPKRDPVLSGRPDYICEVISYGRWIAEVKAPSQPLSTDDAHQAHTYAAHPEIAALFYLLTNGREFRLYRTSYPDDPILTWQFADSRGKYLLIENFLSPNAIKERVATEIDVGQPLARGFGSSVRMQGGIVTYAEHRASNPIFGDFERLDGVRATVVGDSVYRTDNGQIEARLDMSGPYAVWDEMNKMTGLGPLLFRTSDEYISTEKEAPTIFQNLATGGIKAGTSVPGIPAFNFPSYVAPCDILLSAFTEAVGFVEDHTFQGTFAIKYQFEMDFRGMPLLASAGIPDRGDILAHGTFHIQFA